MGELKTVAISTIRENPVALRTVNFDSESYLGLVESIRSKGFLGAVTGRERTDDETGETYIELIDGLHRLSASKDAGFSEINVDIVPLDDDEVQEAQIMANIHKVETRPIEYTQALKRLLTRNSMMTESELASKLGKSTTWVANRLSLNKIDNPVVKSLIEEGRINLSNAYALAKLPSDEQIDWSDRAQTLPPDEFIPQATARLKEIREAKRQGKDASTAEFQPVPHLQKLKAMKDELETGAVGSAFVDAYGVTTAAEGFALGVKWALHMDPQSVQLQKAKDDERRNQRAEKAAKKAAEAAKKKQEKLAKELAEATAATAEAEAASA